ncbi:hypothetical protein CH063_14061 [Colletotrichum higginsianum]|uniref:Uncharacterized protein n=1 Tax=Colletotrichum higginsianum (strain IMI 349063) TaxID=759273 RepID=H1VX08_COLHI|nr:hypothetical protein CH063_14061 [Colletotrichum higginsianum]
MMNRSRQSFTCIVSHPVAAAAGGDQHFLMVPDVFLWTDCWKNEKESETEWVKRKDGENIQHGIPLLCFLPSEFPIATGGAVAGTALGAVLGASGGLSTFVLALGEEREEMQVEKSNEATPSTPLLFSVPPCICICTPLQQWCSRRHTIRLSAGASVTAYSGWLPVYNKNAIGYVFWRLSPRLRSPYHHVERLDKCDRPHTCPLSPPLN